MRITLSVVLAGCAASFAARAQPVGGEFRVNTSTVSNQMYSASAADPMGNFVVVWQSGIADGSNFGITGQRFASSGVPIGGEFRVNETTSSYQGHPTVAVAPSGDFVVVWEGTGVADSSYSGVFARRFASSGMPIGGEFAPHTYTTGSQNRPHVAVDSSGAFVIVWASQQSTGDASGYSIQARRFTSDGTALGGPFQVNTTTSGSQVTPWAARAANGDFVVVWTSFDASSTGVFAQRYASDGSALGGEFLVNAYTSSAQYRAAVAASSSGDFVVVWLSGASGASGGSDASSYSIQMRRFAADGTARGNDFQVNSYTTNKQFHASIAIDGEGSFTVVWASTGGAGSDTSGDSIHLQRFTSAGVALGGELQVNTFTTANQHFPRVATGLAGNFVVEWSSSNQAGAGSGYDVFAQLFTSCAAPDVSAPFVFAPPAATTTQTVCQ